MYVRTCTQAFLKNEMCIKRTSETPSKKAKVCLQIVNDKFTHTTELVQVGLLKWVYARVLLKKKNFLKTILHILTIGLVSENAWRISLR